MQNKENQKHFNNSSEIGMYSFYDKKAERYDTPFFCADDMFAMRHYKMVSEKDGSMIATFKEDFDVHRLGFVNVVTGTYTEKKETIVDGKMVAIQEKLNMEEK